MEPGSLVMERKMLLGIKERAEQASGSAGENGVGSLRADEPPPRRALLRRRRQRAAEGSAARRRAGGRERPGSGSHPEGTPARARATGRGRRTAHRPDPPIRRSPGSDLVRHGRATAWTRTPGTPRTTACSGCTPTGRAHANGPGGGAGGRRRRAGRDGPVAAGRRPSPERRVPDVPSAKRSRSPTCSFGR